MAEHVSQFMKWKDMECPYEKNTRILDYLERSPTSSKAGLHFRDRRGGGGGYEDMRRWEENQICIVL